MRTFLGNLGVSAATLIAVFLVLEVFLRFLPVSEVSQRSEIPATATPFDVSSEVNSSITFSKTWKFLNARTRKTNNMGFFSDFDYKPGSRAIVAIGDSYTEALSVDFEQTFHQLLGRNINQAVYNIALSGSPLSQYEAYLRESCRRFSPSKAIITVVSNDFDESFVEYKRKNGFYHYSITDHNYLKITPKLTSYFRSIVSKSSFVRYLYFHLRIPHVIASIFRSTDAEKRKESNSNADFIRMKKHSVDLFLVNIQKHCLGAKDIVLVVDGDRRHIYGSSKLTDVTLRYFAQRAKESGFATLDLNEVFTREFNERGRMVSFPFDYHWNALGHRLCADELIKLLKITP